MNESSPDTDCQPLIEACTLELYQNNIFRVAGLPVDATSKEVARQVQKLQMLEEMGGADVGTKAAFPPVPPPTADQVRSALARMKEPEHRLVDEFFWYWPETFGKSGSDEAIQALLAGDGQKAVDLWVDRENEGTSKVATHNLAVMFHMYAVDWTNHHLAHGIDDGRAPKIRGYWSEALNRWEELAESDEIWDIMKDRVRSLDDEALTTGFVRRMRRLLPQALDRVNAEAALKLAESGEMDWAKHHVELMRESHQGLDDVETTAELVLTPIRKRVHQEIQFMRSEVDRSVFTYTDAASKLMEKCRRWMAIYDLFHGSESHQRMELFDEVAETVLRLGSKYLKKSTDHSSVVSLLSEALDFASSARIFEEISEAISIVSKNADFEKVRHIFEKLRAIDESNAAPRAKLDLIRTTLVTPLSKACGLLGEHSETYQQAADAVAIVLRAISIDAHNNQKDISTARDANNLALKLAVGSEVRRRLNEDSTALSNSLSNSLSNEISRLLHAQSLLEQNQNQSKASGNGCSPLALLVVLAVIVLWIIGVLSSS